MNNIESLTNQSNIAFYTIIGGLIGSIVTVILTKVLEIIQKSKEHTYNLKQLYFQEKLKSAKRVISLSYITASSLGAISKLYEKIPILEEGIDRDIFIIMNDVFSKPLEKLYESSEQIEQTFLLFFDINDKEFWENESLSNYFQKLSDIKFKVETINVIYDILPKIEGTNIEKKVKEDLVKYKKELKMDVNALSAIFENARKSLIDLIKLIRLNMKKYE